MALRDSGCVHDWYLINGDLVMLCHNHNTCDEITSSSVSPMTLNDGDNVVMTNRNHVQEQVCPGKEYFARFPPVAVNSRAPFLCARLLQTPQLQGLSPTTSGD